ncbi:MAG TPA: hypothetical protein VK581_13005 [Chthoniobacterales bacterium]|nr:hypothetical protein [Chthoniobacterales bacterium]
MQIFLADLVWPALFLEQRLFSWWAIGLGLLVELFFVRWLTGLDWRMSAVADVAMNTASSLLGFFLIPIAGIAWEFFPGTGIYKVFNIGTFNPGTWVATFLLAVLINSALETTVLRYAFKQKPVKRIFWWLALANALSVGLAFASLFRYPPRS